MSDDADSTSGEKPKKDLTKVPGGKARAEALPDERRKQIAKDAATARWAEARPLQAIKRGNFKDEFGIDVDCYVLNDAQKSAVISQRGFASALNIKNSSGTALSRFIRGSAISNALGSELLEKLSKPLIFKGLPAGPGEPPVDAIHGSDVTLLIDVCKALVQASADGKLRSSYDDIVKQAQVILSASAKAGIKGLVYALSGYDATREEVIAAFKAYVQEEAKKYEKEFPNELYDQWYRLYEIPVPERGKPWNFKHLTIKHIYYPLAKSNGKIYELVKANKATGGDRQKKLFQFLNAVGARALRMQIGRVLEMSESSVSKAEYEKKIIERFGGQQEIELTVSSTEPEQHA